MKDTTKSKIGIIIGTNRPTRIGLHMAKWLQNAMQHDELDINLIDLAEINLPFLDEPNMPAQGKYQKDHTKAWSELIKQYDGLVILFPQYNWGYPAVLKNALDYLYEEWANKPVSISCYGNHAGFQGEIAIRLVLQGLHMRIMTANMPITIDDGMFDENGQFKNIDEALFPYKTAAQLVSSEFATIL